MTEPADAVGGGAREALLRKAVEHFAANGIGDQSLRQIATALGTNHRKLIYHFGSRDGLLAAVVDIVERDQRDALQRLLDSERDPLEAGRLFWTQLLDPARTYGGLFFELSGHAIQGQPHAVALRDSLVDLWLEPLADLAHRAGVPKAQASTYARLSVAVSRGLIYDLLVTGDQTAVDDAHTLFTDMLGRAASA